MFEKKGVIFALLIILFAYMNKLRIQ